MLRRCAFCGGIIEKGYVRDARTRLTYCDTQCLPGEASKMPRVKNRREDGVMKCSNPDCNRNIGLVAYRRGWLSKRRYCSRNCRDAIDRTKRAHPERSHATYFEWLFEQPLLNAQPKALAYRPVRDFGWRRGDDAE
jgi:hypothetical protein